MKTKDEKEKEKERKELMKNFNKMTRNEILSFINNNLYCEEYICVNVWKIYVDFMIKTEKGGRRRYKND